MLPSLREERAATYSPFLPIHPRTRVVMQVPLTGIDADKGVDPLARSRHAARSSRRRSPAAIASCSGSPDWAMRWYALKVDYEMAGKDLIDSRQAVLADRARARRRAAGRLQLRAVPRREGAEDLEVEGQRPDHRRVADLRQPGEPVAVHVPEADGGQAAAFRRDPAHGRRLPRLPRRLSAPGMEGAARQSGLARPFRRAAGGRRRSSTAPTRRRRSRSRCCSTSPRSPTATTRRCCGASCAAMRRARRREPSAARQAGSTTPSPISAISSRRRSATARPTRSSARRWRASSAKLGDAAGGRERRGDPARALRHRAADPALSGPERQGRDAGAAGRLQRVLQHDLRRAARRGARAAARLVHRALRASRRRAR